MEGGISGVQRRTRATSRCKSFGLFGTPGERLLCPGGTRWAARWWRERWRRRPDWDQSMGGGGGKGRWGWAGCGSSCPRTGLASHRPRLRAYRAHEERQSIAPRRCLLGGVCSFAYRNVHGVGARTRLNRLPRLMTSARCKEQPRMKRYHLLVHGRQSVVLVVGDTRRGQRSSVASWTALPFELAIQDLNEVCVVVVVVAAAAVVAAAGGQTRAQRTSGQRARQSHGVEGAERSFPARLAPTRHCCSLVHIHLQTLTLRRRKRQSAGSSTMKRARHGADTVGGRPTSCGSDLGGEHSRQ